VYTWSNGRIYSGSWVNNMMHGHGLFTWSNGDKYDGKQRVITGNMKVIISTIKNMDMEFLLLAMESNIKGIGKMENNTGRELFERKMEA
jgi:hypothetical protein